MAVVKDDWRFGLRYFVVSAASALAAAGAIAATYFLWPPATLPVVLVVLVGGFIWFMFWQRRRLGSYHCPKCRRHIPEPTIKHPQPEDPIHYYCPACDIEWDTRLRHPDVD